MSRDNWARLVEAVVRREKIWQMFHDHSRSPSISTIESENDTTSNFSAEITNDSLKALSVSSPVLVRNPVSKKADSTGPFSRTLFSSWYRRWKPKDNSLVDIPIPDICEDAEFDGGDDVREFSFSELEAATDNFNQQNRLSIRGGYHYVYKGRLAGGSQVVVKRFQYGTNQDAELQFQTEIEILRYTVVHPNVIRLLGYCISPKGRMLVYPFMVNGSVASCLRERLESQPPLNWSTRRRIALGTAKGLAYLHDKCDPKVIHRDVKAANILLDADFEAVVADFELAILMDHYDRHVDTAVRGTRTHIAPEYLSSRKCSEKTDVFGYGVFLLELITAQHVSDLARLANDDHMMLLDWVKMLLLEKKWGIIVDPDYKDSALMEEDVEQLIQLALVCTQTSPEGRPKMSKIVMMLDNHGYGLVERWEQWLEEEIMMQNPSTQTNWISDDTLDIPVPEESSGPSSSLNALSVSSSVLVRNPVIKKVDSTGPFSRKLISSWYRRWMPKDNSLVDIPILEFDVGDDVRRFSFSELEAATDNFNQHNLYGRGGYHYVFKGRLADGYQVVVKRFKYGTNQDAELQFQNAELFFQTELEILGRMVAHPNVLRLLGYCITPKDRMLVYPFMVNGSVASCLRERPESRPPLNWSTRRRIAHGTAKGLAYLHDKCDRKIIHRDVKAANILLDKNFEAVVADLELAKLMDHFDDDVDTGVRGTVGHIAPEYLSTGKCTEKSDVYGYGAFLLELITGQRVFDLALLANDDDMMVLDWVKKHLLEKKWSTIMDPDCKDSDLMEEVVEQLIQLALLCTRMSPEGRPKMLEIVMMLDDHGYGLVDRWEQWLEEEIMMQNPSPQTNWISDDTLGIRPEELSGPR